MLTNSTTAQPAPIYKEDTESFLRSIGYWTARVCYVETTNAFANDNYTTWGEGNKLRAQRYYFRAKMREYANKYRCVKCHRWFGTAYLRPDPTQELPVGRTVKTTKLKHICVHCLNPKLPTYDKVFQTFRRIEDRRQHWERLSAPLGSPTDYAHRRHAAYLSARNRLYYLLQRTPRIIHEWTMDDDILNYERAHV